MTGEKKLSNDEQGYVEGKLAEIVNQIENQARIFGLNKIFVDAASADYLSTKENELSKMTPEELALAEIRLQSYSMALQQHSNKAIAIRNWADRSIRLVVAQNYNSYDKYIQYDARRDLVIMENEFAQRLNKVITEQQIIIDEFSYLSQAVQHVAGAFGRFAKLRRVEQ